MLLSCFSVNGANRLDAHASPSSTPFCCHAAHDSGGENDCSQHVAETGLLRKIELLMSCRDIPEESVRSQTSMDEADQATSVLTCPYSDRICCHAAFDIVR